MYPQQNDALCLLMFCCHTIYSKLNKLTLQHFQTFRNDPDNYDGRVFLDFMKSSSATGSVTPVSDNTDKAMCMP